MADRSQPGLRRFTREPTAIGEVLASLSRSLSRRQQAVQAVQEGLRKVLPPDLVDRVEVVGLHGGVATVAVPDAGSKCLLEAAVRGGLVRGLPEALAVRKVKVVLTSSVDRAKIVE